MEEKLYGKGEIFRSEKDTNNRCLVVTTNVEKKSVIGRRFILEFL